MLYIFKIPGKKIAYDSSSGAFIPLTGLTNKMLGALTPPLTASLPTSLRYELAKYDSEDVSEAYDRLYELSEKGLLFAEENGLPKIRISGEFSAESEEEIAEALKLLKAAGADRAEISGESELLSTAEDMKKSILG